MSKKANKARETSNLFPLEFSVLNEFSPEDHSFGDAIMLEDFGPLKKGEHVHWIWFDLVKATCEVFDEKGTKSLYKFPIKVCAK